MKHFKFQPAPDDTAGQKLRKVLDKHNEREAKRRARRKEENMEADKAAEKEVEGNNAPWPREWLKEAWEQESWT